MRASLRRDLTAAFKTGDRVAVSALRSALAAIENAEALPVDHLARSVTENEHVAGAAAGLGAAEVQRRHLAEADLRAIVVREVHERSVAAGDYEQLGRGDLAELLRSETDVLAGTCARPGNWSSSRPTRRG